MKNLSSILMVYIAFFGIRCSSISDINPITGPTGKNKSSNSSLTGARTFVPGLMTWVSGNTWTADFEGGGMLTFNGPTPPIVGIPIFNVQTTNLPAGAAWVSDTGSNTFTETIIFNHLNQGAPYDLHLPDVSKFNSVEDIDVTVDVPSDASTLTLSGKVVTIDGKYYAVASDYQLPNGPKVAIGASVTAHTAHIKTPLTAAPYIYAVYYSTNNGADWIIINGTSLDLNSDDAYIFKTVITNAPGYQTTATFTMTDWQVITSATNVTIPPVGITLTNTTQQVGNQDLNVNIPPTYPPTFTVTISNPNMQAYVITLFYSTDNGTTWVAVSGTSFQYSSIGVAYRFKAVITNAPGNQGEGTIKMSDWQTIRGPQDYQIPVGGSLTLTNTTSYVINSNYTIAFSQTPTP